MLKRICLWIAVLSAALVPVCASAQNSAGSGGVFNNWPAVTTTGYLGGANGYISFSGLPAAPSNHRFQWFNDGTAPSVCTFSIEVSPDGTHWTAVGNSTGTVFSCLAGNHIELSPWSATFLHVNILSYTAGDGTTAVRFAYTRGIE